MTPIEEIVYAQKYVSSAVLMLEFLKYANSKEEFDLALSATDLADAEIAKIWGESNFKNCLDAIKRRMGDYAHPKIQANYQLFYGGVHEQQ